MSEVQQCGGCGASIYPEHVESGLAGYRGGKLLCHHCQAEQGKGGGVADEEPALAPISFDEPEEERPRKAKAVIKAFAADTQLGAAPLYDDAKYTRPLNELPSGATRCRTFHAKLNDQAVLFMNDQINTWVDQNPSIEIKFATSTIGVYEGKHNDPNLIITVFY